MNKICQLVWCRLLLICAFSAISQVYADTDQTVSIGVLAYNGNQQALQRWQPTADYLAQHIRSYKFEIVPLTHEDFLHSINKNQLDFLLTNPGHYTNLEVQFGATRIATFRSRFNQSVLTRFGSVIFTRDDSDITHLADLRGKTMAAVGEQAFGGYQLAYSELLDHGINLDEDMTMLWLGFPQADIVRAVITGKADSGTVRSGVLEKMASSGEIKLEQIRVLGNRTVKGFPQLLSTELYPEWPIARLPRTDSRLAKRVAITLLEMPENSQAAIKSGGAGWTIPLDYLKVHQLFRRLHVDPYPPVPLEMKDFWQGYRHWVVLLGALFLFSLSAIIFTLRINRQLKRSERSLSENRDKLEVTIEQRTSELRQTNQALLEDIESRVQFENTLREGCETLQAINTISTRQDLSRDQRIQSMLDLICQYLGEELAVVSISRDRQLAGFTANSAQEEQVATLENDYANRALQDKTIIRVENTGEWKSYVACYFEIVDRKSGVLELGTPADFNQDKTQSGAARQNELGSQILNLFCRVIANELKLLHYETIAESQNREAVSRFASMTDREFEVLQLVSNGESNKRIAQILDISIKTVELHRSNLLRKTGSSSSVQLIKLATQSRLIN